MPVNTNTSTKQKNRHGKRKLVFVIILVIVIAAGGALLIHHRQLHSKQVATRIPSTGPSVKKPAASSKQATGTATSNTGTTSPDKSTQPSVSDTTLTAPTGTFVSNHQPSLSGDPLLRQEKSVCNATPGATCYILFMKDGLAKTLASQTIDSSGSTYWMWDVNQAGFTQGSWQITAVATLNGQTTTANDSLPLEVQP